MIKKAIATALAISLTACASSQSTSLETPTNNYNYQSVAKSVTEFEGKQVRWGGYIRQAAVLQNGMSKLVIVNMPLNSRGMPYSNAKPTMEESFVAYLPEIIDLDQYPTGKAITVVGNISGNEKDHALRQSMLPVLLADDVKIWPQAIKHSCNDKVLTSSNTSCDSLLASRYQDNPSRARIDREKMESARQSSRSSSSQNGGNN